MRMESKEALDIIRERIDLAEREYAEQVPEYIEALKLSAELLQADANGQLVVLPCKVGDTVYEVQELRKRIQPYTIIAVHISNCSILFGWEVKDDEGIYTNVNGFCDYAIGKTVFLTHEEAEAALEKMGDGEK